MVVVLINQQQIIISHVPPDMSQAHHKSSLCPAACYFYLGRCLTASFLRGRFAFCRF